MPLLDFGPTLSDSEIEVCTCQNIYLDTIKTCIQAGAKHVQEVNCNTNSGSGICGGKWCTPTIENLILRHHKKAY